MLERRNRAVFLRGVFLLPSVRECAWCVREAPRRTNSYCGIVNKPNTCLSAVDLIVAKAAIILYELWRMRSAIFYRDDRWWMVRAWTQIIIKSILNKKILSAPMVLKYAITVYDTLKSNILMLIFGIVYRSQTFILERTLVVRISSIYVSFD